MSTDTLVEGEGGLEAAAAPKPRSEWTMAWRRLRRNKAALVGLGILIVISLAAIFADFIALEAEDFSHNSFEEMMDNIELPPGTNGHIFGTDDIGRDVFSRIVRGSRISLRVGFSAVTISAIVGTFIGLSAGYFGRWVDMVISRFIDVMLAFPGLLLAMTVVAALGSGLNNAMIALGVAGIPVLCARRQIDDARRPGAGLRAGGARRGHVRRPHYAAPHSAEHRQPDPHHGHAGAWVEPSWPPRA